MRPATLIASARAHEATLDQAIATAVSVELLHNAMLVIDDIQDESDERRGRPTLHREHGIPIALNTGSTMSVLSLAPLIRNVAACGPHIALWIFEMAIEVAQACAEGQALELGWRADNRLDVTPAEYLDMVLRKTCRYSIMFPVEAGFVIGVQRRDIPLPVRRYGYLVGAAFQIQDDLLNLVGDPVQYGKELYGDLLEGKRTLITIALLDRCNPSDRAKFQTIMGKRREAKTPGDLAWLLDRIRAYECVEATRKELNRLVGASLHEFKAAFGALPESPDKAFLAELPYWIVEQGH